MPCPRTIYDYAVSHEGHVESEEMADELIAIHHAIFDQARRSASRADDADRPWFWDIWIDLNNRFHTDAPRLVRVDPSGSEEADTPVFEPFVFRTAAGQVTLAMEPLNPLGVEKPCLLLTDPRTGDVTRFRHDAGAKQIVRRVIDLVASLSEGNSSFSDSPSVRHTTDDAHG